MYGFRRRQFVRRIGILLTVAGYLFFFIACIDVPKLMLWIQCPIVSYNSEPQKQIKDVLIEMGLKLAAPLPVYANWNKGMGEADLTDEENMWASIAAQEQKKNNISSSQGAKNQLPGQEEGERKEMESEQKTLSDNTISENSMDASKMQTKEGETENPGQAQEYVKSQNSFIKREEAVCSVDLSACQDYEALLKQFYVIDSSTYTSPEELDVFVLSGQNLTIEKKDNSDTLSQTDYSQTKDPQILIYHTHSQEGYADSVAGDDSTTVMGAGEELARILSEQYGYRVYHHMGKYDVKNRDYAYSQALPEMQRILEENPGIEVIIDLHRDGVSDETRLVTELDGKKTAQVMLFNGLSRTKRIGEIEYLKNEYRQSNLAFSFQLQKTMTEYYPGLARKIYLKGYRYNMHFRPRSLLIELGAQTNTREEVWNALPPLAHSIAMVLGGDH